MSAAAQAPTGQEQAQAPTKSAEPQDLLSGVVDATMSEEMQRLKYDATVSKYYAASGYFGDTPAQSVVKMMIGRDLGLSASVASMSIHIGKSGRPSLAGALIAALLKRAGYDWKFVTHTDTECAAAFYYLGKPMTDEAGKRVTVTWTYDHAKRALLTGPVGDSKAPSMYDKYGADMLFNRMIVRFQRRFAPEVTAGMVVYTPDELQEIEEQDLERAYVTREKAAEAVRAAQDVAERKIAEMKATEATPEVASETKPEEKPEAPPQSDNTGAPTRERKPLSIGRRA